MTGRPLHAAHPCSECPWRKDTEPGQFSAQRYEALRDTCGTRRTPEHAAGAIPEAGFEAPMFACHKSADGKEIACAGWLAVEGRDHLGVRLAVIQGEIPPEALAAQPGWPELFGNYDEMAQTQAGAVRGSG